MASFQMPGRINSLFGWKLVTSRIADQSWLSFLFFITRVSDAAMAADRVFGARLLLESPATHAGYMAWAPHWVAVMQRSPAATAATAWFAVPWSHAMADDVGLPLPPPPGDDRLAFRLRGRLVMVVGGWICWVIGMVALAVAPVVANPVPVIAAIVASLAWSRT